MSFESFFDAWPGLRGVPDRQLPGAGQARRCEVRTYQNRGMGGRNRLVLNFCDRGFCVDLVVSCVPYPVSRAWWSTATAPAPALAQLCYRLLRQRKQQRPRTAQYHLHRHIMQRRPQRMSAGGPGPLFPMDSCPSV